MRSRGALCWAAPLSILPHLLLLLLCVSMATLSKPQWPLQRVPVVLPQQTQEAPPPHFLSPARLDVASHCDPECHKKAPPPDYWDLRHQLSYETLHANGTLTQTAVGIYGYSLHPPPPQTGPAPEATSSSFRPRSRRRRQIFGPDGRFSIAGRDFLSGFPFSTAVKLSTGCSGTLVGERHVLTAAHCVHDGKNYVKGAQKLRVGFLKPKTRDTPASSTSSSSAGRHDNSTSPAVALGYASPPSNEKMKFQWIRARRTHVPKGWMRAGSGGASDQGMDYDYALLELKKPHRRRSMKLGVAPPVARLPGGRVHFSGFDADRPGQLVYRFCPAGEQAGDLLYQHCDAQPGASGSGVYARLWDARGRRWERRVVGVFSGHQWVERDGGGGGAEEFNVAVRVTPLKYAQICYWIKGNYLDCREG